jgi:hypothetical protein
VLAVDASTELDGRAIRLPDLVASACIMHAARARATRTGVLAVDAGTEFDGRSIGNTDGVSSSDIVLTVASVIMVTTENGKTGLFIIC